MVLLYILYTKGEGRDLILVYCWSTRLKWYHKITRHYISCNYIFMGMKWNANWELCHPLNHYVYFCIPLYFFIFHGLTPKRLYNFFLLFFLSLLKFIPITTRKKEHKNFLILTKYNLYNLFFDITFQTDWKFKKWTSYIRFPKFDPISSSSHYPRVFFPSLFNSLLNNLVKKKRREGKQKRDERFIHYYRSSQWCATLAVWNTLWWVAHAKGKLESSFGNRGGRRFSSGLSNPFHLGQKLHRRLMACLLAFAAQDYHLPLSLYIIQRLRSLGKRVVSRGRLLATSDAESATMTDDGRVVVRIGTLITWKCTSFLLSCPLTWNNLIYIYARVLTLSWEEIEIEKFKFNG